MGFSCGIVGLPNVGKSTLFNALTRSEKARAENFPFCTISPNTGRIELPDERLNTIAMLAQSARIIPNFLDIVDVAGLVRGASKGEGLGNQFLGHIRELDAIVHMLRCFEDSQISHVESRIDPLHDLEIVETEFLLADLESLERQYEAMTKRARAGKENDRLRLCAHLRTHLQAGKPASEFAEAETEFVDSFHLLTSRPVLLVSNVGESETRSGNALSTQIAEHAKKRGIPHMTISANLEAQIAQIESKTERSEFLTDLGLTESGLERVASMGFSLLDLIVFFTAGPKETRAWAIQKGTKAPQAAGSIHSDFARGFIAAEIIAYQDYIAHGGEAKSREAGKLRLEGRDYQIAEGDIAHFRFNV